MSRKAFLILKILLGKGSVLDRFNVVTWFSKLLLPEYRFKWPQMDWWNDKGFTGLVEQFDGKHSFNSDRRWMAFQLMRIAKEVDGDTAECGVYLGATSKLILKMNLNSSRRKMHHIFDSFEGLSNPDSQDGAHWETNDLSVNEQVVRENLLPYLDYKFYKGWIPDRFHEVESSKFSFVHVDVDLYQPTKDSISFFYERLNAGAVFLCDDYGFTTCPGATKALDDFMEDKIESMIALSGGGGFFIKGVCVCPDKLYEVY